MAIMPDDTEETRPSAAGELTPTSDDAPTPQPKRVVGRPFTPGNRANPGGRPRTDARLRTSLTKLSLTAVRELGRLLRDPTTPRKVRAQIAIYLVDRRLGRPTTSIGGIDGQPLLPPGAPADSPLAQLLARVVARRKAPASSTGEPGPSGPTPSENGSPGASGEGPGLPS
jgi:hypothetical protein